MIVDEWVDSPPLWFLTADSKGFVAIKEDCTSGTRIEYYLVKVKQGANSLVYICGGHFLHDLPPVYKWAFEPIHFQLGETKSYDILGNVSD